MGRHLPRLIGQSKCIGTFLAPQWRHRRWAARLLPPIDCDLYRPTRTIFEHLDRRTVAGTVIVFDGYFTYAVWRQHEHRTFQECGAANRSGYDDLGVVPRHQVRLRITD